MHLHFHCIMVQIQYGYATINFRKRLSYGYSSAKGRDLRDCNSKYMENCARFV